MQVISSDVNVPERKLPSLLSPKNNNKTSSQTHTHTHTHVQVPLCCRSRQWRGRFEPPHWRPGAQTCNPCRVWSTCFAGIPCTPPTAAIWNLCRSADCSCSPRPCYRGFRTVGTKIYSVLSEPRERVRAQYNIIILSYGYRSVFHVHDYRTDGKLYPVGGTTCRVQCKTRNECGVNHTTRVRCTHTQCRLLCAPDVMSSLSPFGPTTV